MSENIARIDAYGIPPVLYEGAYGGCCCGSRAAAGAAQQQGRLTASLSAVLEKDVALDVHDEPAIIGGIVVRVRDQLIDGSVRSRLAALRSQLAHESLA